MDFSVYCTALVMGLGLIVAIGAQNLFIIKTGLQKRNVFLASGIAALCDIMLIVLGTLFVGRVIRGVLVFIPVLKWAGCIFLAYYGVLTMTNALRKEPKGWESTEKDVDGTLAGSRHTGNARLVIATLTFSLVNPHVYLDTFLIIGNFGSRFSGMRQLSFILGACTASCLWFFMLGFASRKAARLFKNMTVVRCFDAAVALIMFFLAYGLYAFPFDASGL